MDKITALFTLDNGYIQINPCISIYKTSGGYNLNICAATGILTGGKFFIKADSPEALKEAIKDHVKKVYNNSLLQLLQDIENE